MKYINLFEKYLDDEISDKVSDFYDLKQKIKRLESELKSAKNKYAELEDELQPIIESLKDTDERLLITKRYIIKIKTFGYNKTNYSYKTAFELALSKVNQATKNILIEALNTTKTINNIKAKYLIKRHYESNIFDAIKNKIMKLLIFLTMKLKILIQIMQS